ncbi:MAG: ATPase [Actinomycetia bacterium]|nr:ATPase [Actinomycetes bacterium]
MTEQTSTVTADGLTITRVFDAPRQLVWNAWTDPAQFAQWFGGHEADVPLETLSFDVRPGGRWNAVMHTQGAEIPWLGEFREVDEPERLVLTMEDPEGSGNAEVLTVVLTERDGKTEMFFSQLGGHLSEEQYHQTVEGYAAFFAAMADVIAG